MKAYEAYIDGKLVVTGNMETVAKTLKISVSHTRLIASKGHAIFKVIEIGSYQQVYAFYNDDDFVTEGTIQQIAEETKELVVNLRFMASNVARERKIKKQLVKLEGETMIVKRTHGAKFAPVPTNDERREQIKVMKNVPVKPAEWKPSDYTRDLFKHSFKKWRA